MSDDIEARLRAIEQTSLIDWGAGPVHDNLSWLLSTVRDLQRERDEARKSEAHSRDALHSGTELWEAELAAAERDRDEARRQAAALTDIIHDAWGVIANVNRGDLTQERPDWQAAMARWRDRMHAIDHSLGRDFVPRAELERLKTQRLKLVADLLSSGEEARRSKFAALESLRERAARLIRAGSTFCDVAAAIRALPLEEKDSGGPRHKPTAAQAGPETTGALSGVQEVASTKKKRPVLLGPILAAAIQKKGLALPETEEEIAALEAQFKREGTIDYPARLRVPPDFGPSADDGGVLISCEVLRQVREALRAVIWDAEPPTDAVLEALLAALPAVEGK